MKTKPLHPQSRKAAQEKKHFHHVQRIAKRQKQRNTKTCVLISKLCWFRDNLPNDYSSLKSDDIRNLVTRYLKRAGKKVKTKHGPVSVSTDIKELHLEQEMEEYLTCGIEIPDLSSKINLKNLREWDGNPDKVHTIAMTTVKMLK
ncbi:Translation machinery-associated protein [Schistosoma japonicum]|uniref:SJCHGC06378 protein n=1 Tax=Schistosoma japonicum TaxID=6182 RepID=Q5DCP5_SCHJA|nr:SJCHGC06378 protein [Schistosoma japonicum]KAH8855610.1 translation machinery-associated protein 16-like [Schistosoma japonicum]KAH8855612.1 translation machinery-associated protein 16-like [Schistosoma japonicum]TNN10614.1 Translation machinery-associated protein [Schistosoma japonicum]CAX69982.1 hypothetical protein [Schistosoma japonicum]